MSEKEAIVFGGAGFIGSHLIDALIEAGEYARVVSVDINPPRFRNDKTEYVILDVRKEIPIELATPNLSLEIFNFAAVHTTPGHEDWEYFDTNIMGAVRVCKFAKSVNCNSLV